jgi:hypothetical protein
VTIFLSGRVPGRASGPSRSRVNDGGRSQCVFGKLIGYLGFSHRGVFIGEGAASEVDRGVSPIGGAARGWAAPPHGEAGPWLGSDSSSVFWKLRLISGHSAFVLSNFENISCVTFLKDKTAENRELALWHLVNRLVPENA